MEAFLILLGLASEHVRTSRQPFSVRLWLKRHGLDRGVRSAGLRYRAGRPLSPARVVAVVEIPTPSMTDPAAMVMAAGGEDAMLGVTDPRAATRVQRDFGLRTAGLVLPWDQERALVRKARPALANAWAGLMSNPPVMLFGSTDLGPAALRRLAPLVARSMPHLAAEEVAVERFLRTTRPTSVAIASDQHRIGRVTVAVARRLGIRTVVLQHGVPQAPIGYLPVVADAVAAWSQASRQWFLDAGTPSASVVVTGNPRGDALRAAAGPLDGKSDVLLALSPTALRTNVALVNLCLDAMAELGRGRMTIKLHPGQGDWSFVSQLVKKHRAASRVAVRRHESLGPLLNEASVVVVHRSSVAVDALAAGRPVIVGRVGREATTADLELAALNLPTCESARDLAGTLADLAHPGVARSYFSDRNDALATHIGPIGGSAARILDLMQGSSEP